MITVIITLLVACPVSAFVGLLIAQWSIRRSFDRETENSYMRSLPVMLGIERDIRKKVVDRQCELVKRRQGEAAYCDIHILGRELTVVGAQPSHLEAFAYAVDQGREVLEAAMRDHHRKHAANDRAAPVGERFNVIDGGKK